MMVLYQDTRETISKFHAALVILYQNTMGDYCEIFCYGGTLSKKRRGYCQFFCYYGGTNQDTEGEMATVKTYLIFENRNRKNPYKIDFLLLKA
jgi:hypothetical protein